MFRLFSSTVTVCALLLASCFIDKPAQTRTPGATLATVNDKAGQIYLHTGGITTVDLDKMSTSGEAHYKERFLYARMNNHLAHPLGNVTLRVVVTSKHGEVRADDIVVRKPLAAPHSDFQVVVRVKRQPRADETWTWSLVDGDEGADLR
jgi:hypothetical protein